jgi:hypothetical protein
MTYFLSFSSFQRTTIFFSRSEKGRHLNSSVQATGTDEAGTRPPLRSGRQHCPCQGTTLKSKNQIKGQCLGANFFVKSIYTLINLITRDSVLRRWKSTLEKNVKFVLFTGISAGKSNILCLGWKIGVKSFFYSSYNVTKYCNELSCS